MLRDELPPRASDAAIFSRIKYDEHEELDQQVSQFIAMGGGITEIPLGVTANTQGVPLLRNEYTGEASMKEYEARSNSQQKAAKKRIALKCMEEMPIDFDGANRVVKGKRGKWGENIKKSQRKSKDTFFFVLNHTHYGANQGWSLEEAKKQRDITRAALGLREALY